MCTPADTGHQRLIGSGQIRLCGQSRELLFGLKKCEKLSRALFCGVFDEVALVCQLLVENSKAKALRFYLVLRLMGV